MSLNRLLKSAPISGSGLSSLEPTFKKLAKWASKLGSTEAGSAIFSERVLTLNLVHVDTKNEFEKTIRSTRSRTTANLAMITGIVWSACGRSRHVVGANSKQVKDINERCKIGSTASPP